MLSWRPSGVHLAPARLGRESRPQPLHHSLDPDVLTADMPASDASYPSVQATSSSFSSHLVFGWARLILEPDARFSLIASPIAFPTGTALPCISTS